MRLESESRDGPMLLGPRYRHPDGSATSPRAATRTCPTRRTATVGAWNLSASELPLHASERRAADEDVDWYERLEGVSLKKTRHSPVCLVAGLAAAPQDLAEQSRERRADARGADPDPVNE